MPPFTIVDVARQAGVSISTASRVLSSSTYPVSPAARQKVIEAAANLKYTPNSLARSLRSQHSNLIAVIVGDNADPYFAQVMHGVEEVASTEGYLTIICNSGRKPEKELNYLKTLHNYRTDGILFASGGLDEPGYPEQLDEVVRDLRNQGTAVITLAQHTLQVPSVQPDNFGGARAMTARLVELGHRRIAFVTGPANLVVANLRLQGYMAALAEANIPIDPRLIIAGNFNRLSGEQAAARLVQIAAEIRPTAVFAANDETALGIMKGVRKAGWHIPLQLSLCGFGDIPMAEVVEPDLTTVSIDLRELGRAGMRKLLGLLNDEKVNELDILPTRIVERHSTSRYSPD